MLLFARRVLDIIDAPELGLEVSVQHFLRLVVFHLVFLAAVLAFDFQQTAHIDLPSVNLVACLVHRRTPVVVAVVAPDYAVQPWQISDPRWMNG